MKMKTTTFVRHLLSGYLDWVAENENLKAAHIIAMFDQIAAPDWLKDDCHPDGTIRFDLSPIAVLKYRATAYGISFQARFKGIIADIVVPYSAMVCVMAVNTQGFPQTLLQLGDVQAASTATEIDVDAVEKVLSGQPEKEKGAMRLRLVQ
jgi:stringent starvation protein B